MPAAEAISGSRPAPRQPGRGILLAQLAAVAAAIAVAALTAGSDHWRPAWLVIIAAFAILSELTSVDAGSRIYVSGSFLGIVLAAVVLGGGPALVVATLAVTFGWFLVREAPHNFRANLVNYAWYALLTGIFFHAVMRLTSFGPGTPSTTCSCSPPTSSPSASTSSRSPSTAATWTGPRSSR